MSTPPSRQISQAIAWLLLAVAVTGGVRIVGRSDDSPSSNSLPETFTAKTRRHTTERIANTDSPQQVVEALMARRPGTERDSSLRQTVGKWAEETPDAALEWLKHLEPGEERDWLMCTAAISIVDQDAAAAAAILETELPSGPARNHAIVAIAQRWVQFAPDEARSWVDSLEPSPAKDEALTEIEKISVALSTADAQ